MTDVVQGVGRVAGWPSGGVYNKVVGQDGGFTMSWQEPVSAPASLTTAASAKPLQRPHLTHYHTIDQGEDNNPWAVRLLEELQLQLAKEENRHLAGIHIGTFCFQDRLEIALSGIHDDRIFALWDAPRLGHRQHFKVYDLRNDAREFHQAPPWTYRMRWGVAVGPQLTAVEGALGNCARQLISHMTWYDPKRHGRLTPWRAPVMPRTGVRERQVGMSTLHSMD